MNRATHLESNQAAAGSRSLNRVSHQLYFATTASDSSNKKECKYILHNTFDIDISCLDAWIKG